MAKSVRETKSEFLGAWCSPATKRKLRALALLSGRSQSAILVDLVDRAPVGELIRAKRGAEQRAGCSLIICPTKADAAGATDGEAGDRERVGFMSDVI